MPVQEKIQLAQVTGLAERLTTARGGHLGLHQGSPSPDSATTCVILDNDKQVGQFATDDTAVTVCEVHLRALMAEHPVHLYREIVGLQDRVPCRGNIVDPADGHSSYKPDFTRWNCLTWCAGSKDVVDGGIGCCC